MLKSDRKSEKSRANNDSFSTTCLLPSKCVSAKQKEQVTEVRSFRDRKINQFLGCVSAPL